MSRTGFAAAVLMASTVFSGAQAANPALKSSVRKATSSSNTKLKIVSQRALDISLDAKGHLSGVLVDSQGKPLAGRKVALLLRPRINVTTGTDSKGTWKFANVKGGQYELASKNSRRLVRVWTHGRSPKKTTTRVLLVETAQVVRGQSEILGLTGASASVVQAGLLVGAAAGAGFAISEANDSPPNSPN
jgi:hypothetical protein